MANPVGLSTGEMHEDDLSHAISEVPLEHAPLRITVTKEKPTEEPAKDSTPDYDPFQAAADRVKAGVTTHPGGLLEKLPDAALETVAEPIRKIRGLLDALNRQYSPDQYGSVVSDSDPQPSDYSGEVGLNAMMLAAPMGYSRAVTAGMKEVPKPPKVNLLDPNEFKQLPYVDHGIPNLSGAGQKDLDQLHQEATESGWWKEYREVHKTYSPQTGSSPIEKIFSHATEQEQFDHMLEQISNALAKPTASKIKIKPKLDTTEDVMAALEHVLGPLNDEIANIKSVKNIPINEAVSDAVGNYIKQPSFKKIEDVDSAKKAGVAAANATWEDLKEFGVPYTDKKTSMYQDLKDQMHGAIDLMAQKVYANIYKGKMSKLLKEFDWEDLKTPKTLSTEGVATKVDPEYMKEIGFNPDALLFKGGWKEYPKTGKIMDPTEKALEKGFFLTDDPKIADHYGSGITMYVARPTKPVMIDWKSATGDNYYSPARMHTLIEAARAKDADMIVVKGIDDIGAKKQSQYIVLDPSILRAPTAAFDPNKLHINHVMMSLGGVITPVVLFSHGDPAKAGEIINLPVTTETEIKARIGQMNNAANDNTKRLPRPIPPGPGISGDDFWKKK